MTEIVGFSYSYVIPDYQPARRAISLAEVAVGGALAKRGRPRKSGLRKACGRLRDLKDNGSEMMLEHRAELVGSGHAADSRAGYPLGILNIRGEIDRAEHDAGVRYAALRAIVYGSATPRSHLAMWQVILGSNSLFFDSARDDQEAKASTDLRAAVAYILIDGRRPLDVLTNVAVLDGGWERNAAEDEPKEFKMNEFGNLVAVACEAGCYLSRRDHQALKAALDRLVRLWRIPRERD